MWWHSTGLAALIALLAISSPDRGFAESPDGTVLFQNVRGCSAMNSIFTTDLMLLKPYFQGTTNRRGAPCCFGSGCP